MIKLLKFFKLNSDTSNMTEGNLFKKIILYALPFMFTTFMQLLYVTIDLMTVHIGDGSDSMASIASNTALINLIVIVFMGTSIGANVLISEAKGANNPEKAKRIMHTSIVFAFITGIFVGVTGFFISDNLLDLMGTEAAYFDKAALYLKIYFVGLPFLMLYNYSAQILRGMGDSKTPFFALTIAGIINVIFDCIFVFVSHLGVAGVALATIISEIISSLICLYVLFYGRNNYLNLSFKSLRIDANSLNELLKIGLPAGLQGFFFSLPNVFIQSSLYTIDPGNIYLENGATAASNLEGYFYAGAEAIATAVMTFIAANVGAKNKDNIKKIIIYGAIWGSLYCLLLALLTLILHNQLLSLFVTHPEEIKAGYQRLMITGYPYIFDFTMVLTASILRGMKRSTYPMVTTLVCCTGLRILLILTLFKVETFHTLFWLYALFPISWVLATLSNLIAILIFLPKDLRKLEISRQSRI